MANKLTERNEPVCCIFGVVLSGPCALCGAAQEKWAKPAALLNLIPHFSFPLFFRLRAVLRPWPGWAVLRRVLAGFPHTKTLHSALTLHPTAPQDRGWGCATSRRGAADDGPCLALCAPLPPPARRISALPPRTAAWIASVGRTDFDFACRRARLSLTHPYHACRAKSVSRACSTLRVVSLASPPPPPSSGVSLLPPPLPSTSCPLASRSARPLRFILSPFHPSLRAIESLLLSAKHRHTGDLCPGASRPHCHRRRPLRAPSLRSELIASSHSRVEPKCGHTPTGDLHNSSLDLPLPRPSTSAPPCLLF
ncbi:hypothetical protein L1887_57558 [Cichorium endivia]|nr:hypothetical protein L1887_57558 [Cichorium endivia]